ncbi:MAG TPA: MopE-related protein [Candidatus Limnocylindrales bacterium]|nr:MopE-related protein [Candidatus Limnocylindrales bacterium]
MRTFRIAFLGSSILALMLQQSTFVADAQSCQPELCNDVDDDCDGVADEDFPEKGQACTAGVGACQSSGSFGCTADGTGLQCNLVVPGGTPSAELCNDIDDDCDSLVDEDFPGKGQACSAGVGACQSSGSLVCSANGTSLQCSAVPGTPSAELCNDVDDDCDGLVDENFAGKGQACSAGVGACQSSGSLVCSANGTGLQCSAVPGTPSAEICDDVDDDCDGVIADDPCTPPPAACPASAATDCAASGADAKATLGLKTKPGDTAGVKNKLKWKQVAGLAIDPAEFGDPTTTESFALCIYDDGDLVLQSQVGPHAERWKAVSNGFLYKDKFGSSDGITLLQLVGGTAGSSMLAAKGRGTNLPMPDPVGTTRFFEAATSVVVQLHGTQTCYETVFLPAEITKNDGEAFFAKHKAVVDGTGPDNEDPDAVYVDAASGADDASCGPQATPCASVTFGLSQAIADARLRVYVSADAYFEDVAVVAGIDLLGGYDTATWTPSSQRSVLYGTSGAGHRAAVSAIGISTATDVTGFAIHGATATTAGANSYAVYVNGSSSQLSITDNVIYAGSGAPGAAASAANDGSDGVPGEGRLANPSGYDAFITSGSGPCDATNNRQLANGGVLTCGATDVSGGNGGGNTCPTSNSFTELSAHDGATGANTGGAGGDAGDDSTLDETNGSLCYVPSGSTEGVTGISGAAGAAGSAGSGCSAAAGTVIDGHWISGSASSGAAGTNGRGGGGGGGGGGSFCASCTQHKDRLGGHGGGGGSGGCGGGGGTGGGGGGGSFGLFVSGGTAPVLQDNIIYGGAGGSGGVGARAGHGGAGGSGGGGGTSALFCASSAGNGGDGGDGGPGGGGGGGCGGSSFGIYTAAVGSPTYCTSNIVSGGSAGAGGQGGPSLVNNGNDGANGLVTDCSFN